MNCSSWLKQALLLHPDPEVATLELSCLVEFCTGLSPTQQRISDLNLSSAQIEQLNTLMTRLVAGEPLAYLVGSQPFWDITLKVTPATLIPRADTEVLIERVLTLGEDIKNPVIYDLGTGSGAIAIVLAREIPTAQVIGSDFSSSALAIARQNAEQYQLKNLTFLKGSWLQPFPSNSADIIVSNPPYIATNDPHLAALRHEPNRALISEKSGYQDLFSIIKQAPRVLRAGGWLLLEHGYQQGREVRLFASQMKIFEQIKTRPDRAGRERFTEMAKTSGQSFLQSD